MSKEQIIEGALALSEEDRGMLVEELLLSLDHSSPDEIEKAWIDEAEKRVDDFLAGNVKTYDAKEVLNELRSSHLK